MALFQKNDGGIMDVIRCDESDYLIWKWHPKGSLPSESQRANSIRWGSSLRVRDGSVAVFVYSHADGIRQDFIEGPFDEILETSNLPVLADLLGTLYNGASPFQAEIYFINLRDLIQVKFGVPYFDVFDPRFPEFGVPTAVRGSINFKISDYREFIRLHSLDTFDMGTFKAQIKDSITRLVKSIVTNAPDDAGIPVVQLERQLSEINALVERDIRESLWRDYGVNVTRVDISDIEIDKKSKGYKKLQSITQNKAAVFTHAAANLVDSVSIHRIGAKKIVDNVRKNAEQPAGIIEDIGAAGQKVTSALSGVVDSLKKTSKTDKPDDVVAVLKQYKELLDEGIITQEEFDKKKQELLD